MRRPSRSLLSVGAAVAAVAVVAAPSWSAVTTRPPHVLAYSQTSGFRHISIEHSKEVLRELSRGGRFTIEFTEDPKALTPAKLARTDVLLWLSNTAASGRVSPFTDAQEKAYAAWMSCGGGHIGVHAAVDSYDEKAFPAYAEANGAIFAGHPVTATSAADDQTREDEGWGEPEAEILVKDQSTPMTKPWRGQQSFRYRDEFYKLDRDPGKQVRDYRLLLALGQFTDPQAIVTSQVYPGAYDPEAPLAWSGSYRGKNRTFYTNLGHSVVTWDDPSFQQHLVNGVTWVAAKRPDGKCLRRSGIRR